MRLHLVFLLLSAGSSLLALPTETLTSVGGLPAHIAGAFQEMTACEQAADGEYFVFDRRAHAVFSVPPPLNERREVIRIGSEPGRVLRPYAFDLGDGTFVIADAPGNRGRVQVFFATGTRLGGFTLTAREMPPIVLDDFIVNGMSAIEYTGRSVLLNEPEVGALVTEYALDGRVLRTFGSLRATSQEQDREVHLALNAGVIVVNPKGGFYFVFVAGTPLFRKYDAEGKLVFERHVEGAELDEYMRTMPNSWPRKRNTEGKELPVIHPAVRAAGADRAGNLWISLTVPYTYVYDGSGDKRRTIQFRAAGIISPRSLFFTHNKRVLVTPGCYAFPVG
jgi:hypothetical protein